MKVTIIFDKERKGGSLHTGWGIAYLVGDTLFDTSEKQEYLLENMAALGIEADSIKRVFLSHNHWDHRSGLWELCARNKNAQVYACADFVKEFKDRPASSRFHEVADFSRISEDLYTSGCFTTAYKSAKVSEHFLIVRTGNGISCVLGCAHPGLLTLLQKVKERFPHDNIYSVFGGFHLLESDPRLISYIITEMKNIGVKKAGPAHCSGHEAIAMFKEAYGEDFLDIRAGAVLDI